MNWLAPLLLLFTACGEDDGEGGSPDLFLGLSGLVIVLILGWIVYQTLARRR